MKKNHYYCITKNNVVVYVSTSENAFNKTFSKLEGDYQKSVINTLGVLQNEKEQIWQKNK